MKKWLALLLAALLVLSCAAFAETAEEKANFVDAKVITKVTDFGERVAGVRIEYDKALPAGTFSLSSFSFNGFDVIRIYLNSTGIVGEAASEGNFVFVEFDIGDFNGSSKAGTMQYTGRNNLMDTYQLTIADGYTRSFYNTNGFIHFETDDYSVESFSLDGTVTTPYRFFVPANQDEALPLVIWLHGAGESGEANYSQLAANRGALNWSSAKAQAAHPCYVLAPEAHEGWSEAELANVKGIVNEKIAAYNIDPARIYVNGCSMGGGGTRRLTATYPEMIAAALVTANSSLGDDEAALAAMKDIPLIIVSAADDGESAEANMVASYDFVTGLGYNAVRFLEADARNGYLRGTEAKQNMQPVIDAMAEAGANWAFVTYIRATVQPAAHWSWMAATENEAIHDWMFSQVKAVPYAAE